MENSFIFLFSLENPVNSPATFQYISLKKISRMYWLQYRVSTKNVLRQYGPSDFKIHGQPISKISTNDIQFCQAQAKAQLQVRWPELSLISNSSPPPSHPATHPPSARIISLASMKDRKLKFTGCLVGV